MKPMNKNTQELEKRLREAEEACAALRAELEAEKEKKPRAGDVRCGVSYGDHFACAIVSPKRDIFDWVHPDGRIFDCPLSPCDKFLFNVFDLAAAFPEGIPDPSELVRKSDVVAALSIFDEDANESFLNQKNYQVIYPQSIAALRALGIVPAEKARELRSEISAEQFGVRQDPLGSLSATRGWPLNTERKQTT